MKKTLSGSVPGVTLCLLIFSIGIFLVLQKAVASISIIPSNTSPSERITPLLPPPAAPARLHWNQLESEKYPAFVANLRAIGCPEQTIRDIVSAEVRKKFNEKHQQTQTTPGQPLNPAEISKQQAEQESYVSSIMASTIPNNHSLDATSSPFLLKNESEQLILQTIASPATGILTSDSTSATSPKATLESLNGNQP
ncbi:hypothetical protein BH11VER1_BH11VER1_29830 [soil metagenome]